MVSFPTIPLKKILDPPCTALGRGSSSKEENDNEEEVEEEKGSAASGGEEDEEEDKKNIFLFTVHVPNIAE